MNRNVIFLAALAAVLGVYVFLIAPLAEKRAGMRERLEMDYATLVKHERFIKRTKDTGVQLEGARKELGELEKSIIRSKDKSLAFAKLQAKIQDLASAAGLRISTIKLLPAVTHKGYFGLPIFVDSTGDIRNLSNFLRFLDSSREYIGIEALDISTSPKGKLRIRMQLAGLMKA
jgi:Tfp pilus assembly protein PilO